MQIVKTAFLKLNVKKQHQTAIDSTLTICSQLYNHFLQERISLFTAEKKTLSCFDQQKTIKDIRPTFDPDEAVHSQVIQDVCKRVAFAYDNFFRRVKQNKTAANKKAPGFPRFKTGRYHSFTYKQYQNGWKIITDDHGYIRKIKLSKIGSISVFNSFKLPNNAKLLTATVNRKADGYFCSLTYSYEQTELPPRKQPKGQPLFPHSNVQHKPIVRNEVGVDVGIRDFITTSDGDKINCPALEAEFQELKALNRVLRNKKKHRKDKEPSRRFRNLRQKIAKQHLKIKRVRADFQQKLANYLLFNYSNIFIEQLNIGKIILNKFSRDFSRRVHSAAWSNFFGLLDYKAANADNSVVKVDAAWTSQICSYCLEPAPKELAVKQHFCEVCGLVEDRDVNAAKIILLSGISPESLSVPKARLALAAKAARAQIAEAPTMGT